MATKRARKPKAKPKKIVDGDVKNGKPDESTIDPPPKPKVLSVALLRAKGHKLETIAKVANVSPRTVSRYLEEAEAWFGEQPEIQAYRDRFESLTGQAVDVYEDFLNRSEEPAQQYACARDILNSVGVSTERQELDLRFLSDEELNGLIAQLINTSAKTGTRNSTARKKAKKTR